MKIVEVIQESKRAALALAALLSLTPAKAETMKEIIDDVVLTGQQNDKTIMWGYIELKKRLQGLNPHQMKEAVKYYMWRWDNMPDDTYDINLQTLPVQKKSSKIKI